MTLAQNKQSGMPIAVRQATMGNNTVGVSVFRLAAKARTTAANVTCSLDWSSSSSVDLLVPNVDSGSSLRAGTKADLRSFA